MSDERRITTDDLALYAMQLLSPVEAAEVSAFLDRSSEARRELAEIQADLGMYAHTVEMHTPSAQARERLTKQVAREKKVVPVERRPEGEVRAGAGDSSGAGFRGAVQQAYDSGTGLEMGLGKDAYVPGSNVEEMRPKKSVAAKVLPWVGWAVAAGLAVTSGDLYREREALRGTVVTQATEVDHLSADAAAARQVLDTMTDRTAMRVTLTEKGQPPAVPQGRATYVANKGTLIFVANNLQPLDATKTYELWLIPAATGQSPIPAGTFRPDERGNASVIMPPLPKGVEAKAFGVTVEDEGGATTPTLPIILVGT
ncbi:MAG: anti-sigma factor [Acidobacteriota bacterium]|nr:anti-sigma factor [Acidobacteriota bacterium]